MNKIKWHKELLILSIILMMGFVNVQLVSAQDVIIRPNDGVIVPIKTPVMTTSVPLTIESDISTVYVGIPTDVTFRVTRECGTIPYEVCAAIYPPPQIPVSEVDIQINGVVTGSGITDENGEATITINAENAGTIIAVATKSGYKSGYKYKDSSITIVAEDQAVPTPTITPYSPKISVSFISDKSKYSRGELIYLTMKNNGEDSVELSNTNSIHWWIENIIYGIDDISEDTNGEAAGDADTVVATSESPANTTILLPGQSVTLIWDQRDRNGNLAPSGTYRGGVEWLYKSIYNRSYTQEFEIFVSPDINTPTPLPYTYTPVPSPTIISDTPVPVPNIISDTPVPVPNIISSTPVPVPNIIPTKEKFRVGPTVNLRPVKDDINKAEDGLIELYIDNPSLNEYIMYADIRISVPSGISIYGQGFGDAGSAGVMYGTFDISPGKSRTIQMTVRAEKTGEFLIKFSGLYWPGNNKDEFQPISLTHYIKVHDSSIISTPTVTPEINTGLLYGIGTFIKNLLDYLNDIFKK